jgi:carboxyl-terminal processing protease
MRVSAALILASIVLLTATWAFHQSLRNSFRWTCEIVHEAYYKKDSDLDQWRKDCLDKSDDISYGSTKQNAIAMMNDALAGIRTSHLSIYSPEKSDEMWDNRAIDNGLRVRIIDGSFIIYKIVEGSAASNFEIKVGDEIIAINEQAPRSAYDLRFSSGEFEFKRPGEENFVAVILAEELTEDLSPTFRKINANTGVLELPSFLPQYFDKEKWLKLTQEFVSTSNLIIDLRGNSGGSFVSMLRALSPFFCKPTSVGLISAKILDGKNQAKVKKSLEDDLEARIQIDQIESEDSLLLKTFDGYGCSKAKVRVLVDSDSASTAEIFAYAIKLRANTEVSGVPTAGQVVVARWYDLSPLGFGGHSLSIPIAGFATLEGQELEEEGITPTKLLFYDLEESRSGKDSWLLRALEL